MKKFFRSLYEAWIAAREMQEKAYAQNKLGDY
jgi:hypothetical protein